MLVLAVEGSPRKANAWSAGQPPTLSPHKHRMTFARSLTFAALLTALIDNLASCTLFHNGVFGALKRRHTKNVRFARNAANCLDSHTFRTIFSLLSFFMHCLAAQPLLTSPALVAFVIVLLLFVVLLLLLWFYFRFVAGIWALIYDAGSCHFMAFKLKFYGLSDFQRTLLNF